MSKKLYFLISFILMLSLTSTTYGIVIGNFENSMDGWTRSDPNAMTEYSSTTGVTRGDYNLRLSAPGDNINALSFGLSGQVRNDFLSRKILTIDVTRLASEWTASGEYCDLILAVNGGGSGWTVWQEITDPISDWSPEDGDQTVTLTFDYSSILGDINLNSIWWFELFLITVYDPNYYNTIEPHYTSGGVYYLDNIQLLGDERAYNPNPSNGMRDVQREPTLRWEPGTYADTHDVYFGTSSNSISGVNRNNLASYPDVTFTNTDANSFKPGTLQFNTTFHWRVDEVNDAHPDRLWKGVIWSFTTGNYFAVDDFEDYNDYTNLIYRTWRDGYGEPAQGIPGNGTGSIVGWDRSPIAEQETVHSGFQSMPMDYNNLDEPYYSEAVRTWDTPQDWTKEGSVLLTIWFHGLRQYVGGTSYDSATRTYTMTGSGTDIWDNWDARKQEYYDEFHFAYKQLSGAGSIIAKIESLTNTDPWAKAGVMIRETLDANSPNATVVVTPESGVAFQYRIDTGGLSQGVQQEDVNAPHWVKLIRSANTFTAQHSADGQNWVDVQGDLPSTIDIPMGVNTYIGLALTAHDPLATGEAVFSNVSTTGTVSPTGPFTQSQDIGIRSNVADKLYVILEDNNGISHLVERPEPNATQIYEWQDWNINLQEFSDADVNVTAIKKMTIGVGNTVAASATGRGKVFFDDIRVYNPGCILSKRSADFAKADYAPAGDPAGDCLIDYKEVEIMARDWLDKDEFLDAGAAGFIAYYPLDEGAGTTAADVSGNGNNGTFVGNPLWASGQIVGALHFNGTNDCVDLGNNPVFNPSGSLSISLWAYITDWSENWNHTLIGNRGEDGVGWQLRRHSNENFCFTTRGITRDDTASETIPPLDEWIHIACVYDNTNNNKSIYMNGVEDRVVTTNPGSITATTHNTYIGARANSGNTGQEAFFSGMLDDVRIYNRPLLPGEVEFLADPIPGDGQLYIPVPSPAELYEAEPRGSRAVNFMDFAVLTQMWLEEQLWP